MKKIMLILLVGVVSNVIAVTNSQEKLVKQKTNKIINSNTGTLMSAFFVGVVTGILGLKYYSLLFFNKTTADDKEKIRLGAGVAQEIEKYDNNPIAYIAQCLADGHIAVLEENDEGHSAIRVRKFYIPRNDLGGKEYSFEELQPARKLLLQLEEKLEAYNAYAKTLGKVPLIVVKEYEKVYFGQFGQIEQNVLRAIGIKKSIARTSNWIK